MDKYPYNTNFVGEDPRTEQMRVAWGFLERIASIPVCFIGIAGFFAGLGAMHPAQEPNTPIAIMGAWCMYAPVMAFRRRK